MIAGNMVGSYSQLGKTFILLDDEGNEITGVVVDKEIVFTAGDNDVREGMIYASDDGVSTGTKNIPAYRTTKGMEVIMSGQSFSIPLSHNNKYDFTKLQCIIAPLNTNEIDSIAAEKIVINDGVYPVSSTIKLSDVTKNHITKSIDFNIVNDSDNFYFIHYLTYREEE